MTHTRAPFGAWKSPITSELIGAGSLKLRDVALFRGDVFWLEMRPAEGGRYVVMREVNGVPTAVTPDEYNVRTRVHEYGGGAFLVAGDSIYFCNDADQRLYRQPLTGGAPRALTPEGQWRYADFAFDSARKRLVAVCEDHAGAGEAKNSLVTVDIEGGAPQPLVRGHDFYAAPRLSPDGTRLAWLAWNHPNLPWDATQLYTGIFDAEGRVEAPTCVAGDTPESIFQPAWSPAGVLHFVSDRTGFWNLYKWERGFAHNLHKMEAEFGLPLWTFDMATYGFTDDGQILCTYAVRGEWELARLFDDRFEKISTAYTEFENLRVDGKRAAFVGGAPTQPTAIVEWDLLKDTGRILRRTTEAKLDERYLSIPRAIEFPTQRGRTAHGFFYPPRNGDYLAPNDERPPLIVISHGGPTGAATTTFSLEIQYWTSRGFGVLDVNYGGSTGYGRDYRERLRGQWGVVDVEDCLNGAKFLVGQGEVAREKLAIRGGSAGGYTTLAALAFHDYFTAGASYYGVSDILALMKDTHKFEARYDHFLVGPMPQSEALYRERSPINHVDKLSTPLILFQGLEDKIVPPNQAEAMVAALKAKGVPVEYHAYAGEQHGFRRAETIKASLEAELAFYRKIFRIEESA